MFKGEKFKKFGRYLFVGFLFFYAFTMIRHTLHLEFELPIIILFLLGLSLAIFAHARQNYFTIILLLLHMSIEWFEWSQTTFTLGGILLSLGHIAMDFIFLSHELSAHMKMHKKKILTFVSVFLVAIFGIGYFFLREATGIEGVVEIVEPFVVGGVLGCIFSHLFYHFRKSSKKEECCH